MPSLSESFNEKYSGGRASYESPDERPESLEDVECLSPRWQQLWMLEELLDVELEIWSKNRAKLNTDDIQAILDSTLDSLDAIPVIVEALVEEENLIEEVKE